MKKSEIKEYESPTTIELELHCAPICASKVETVDPEEWEEGNTNWWN